MNKKLTKLLSIFAIAGAISAGAAVGLAGCGNKHEHEADSTWHNNETQHWHECTANDGEKMNAADHVDANNDGKCDVCDYQISTGGGEDNPGGSTGGNTDNPGGSTGGETGGGEDNPGGSTGGEELNLSISISGETTVAVGGTIQLTATVDGVPTGGEAGVTWSVDDATVATIDENGLLTGVSTGPVTVTATSKLDSTVSETLDVVVTAATYYDQLAIRADNRIAENFSSYTDGQSLAAYSSWGTRGVYAKGNVTIAGGQAKAYSATKAGNMSVMVDFGSLEGAVEGYFKYQFTAVSNNGEGNSINFYSGSEKVLTIITSGSNYVIKNIPGVAAQPTTTLTCDTNSMAELKFKFDLANKKVSLSINDTVICEELACDINEVSGVELVTSNGGLRGVIVDDIAVCGAELTAATQTARYNAKLAATEGLASKSYYTDAKAAFDTAAAAATTVSGVDEAYAQLVTAIKTGEKAIVNAMWAEGYTHDAEGIATLKTSICESIDAASDVDDVLALVTSDALAGKLADADLHEDSYYAQVDVTVVIYEKNTTTSVVKTGATGLTDKDGQSIKLATLKAAIEVPSGKLIKALYSDAACATEITGDYVLNANGAVEATTVTIYVEFVESQNVTHTLIVPASGTTYSADTLINDIFYATANVKTESVKNGVEGYGLQISLTKGKATTSGNSIKFTITGTATVTVVCGQKSDKDVGLSVLGSDGSAATVSNITLNGASASSFDKLSKTSTPDTYTFTLAAGTYYLGGDGGGAYIWGLTVVETVVKTAE